MANAKAKSIKVTLVKSVFGQLKSHRATVKGLGLRRIRDSKVLADTPEIRGMIRVIGSSAEGGRGLSRSRVVAADDRDTLGQ